MLLSIAQLYYYVFHTPIGNVAILPQLHQFHASNLFPISLFDHAISLILHTFSDPYLVDLNILTFHKILSHFAIFYSWSLINYLIN